MHISQDTQEASAVTDILVGFCRGPDSRFKMSGDLEIPGGSI